MSTELETAKTEKEAKVASAWSKIGLAMSQTDMQLQAMAQKALAKVKIPKTVAEIVDGEKLITELRNDYTEIQSQRKVLTSKLDAAIAHLMKSEKLISGDEKAGIPSAVKPIMDALVLLKKQDELDRQKIQWHDDEIKRNKEIIANHVTNHDATCKQKIINLVDNAYSFALGNGDVKLEEVWTPDLKFGTFLKKVINGEKAGEKEFHIAPPIWTSKYTSAEENQELWDNAVMDVRSPMDYRQDLHDALGVKFEFYNIAVKNKAESLKQAAEDKEVAEQELLKKKGEAEAANKLNSIATVHSATPITTHKELKKVYEIDMVENDWVVASQVVAAFIGNLEKCKDAIRVTNNWNLKISQMREALCKVKNADPAFEFGTLKFKSVDKL
jgi:D-ribose pyranose/furanose isomerase RbsD